VARANGSSSHYGSELAGLRLFSELIIQLSRMYTVFNMTSMMYDPHSCGCPALFGHDLWNGSCGHGVHMEGDFNILNRIDKVCN